MDHNSPGAAIGAVLSVITAAISIAADIQPFIALSAGIVAIISGCMAIRYYYKATKKF